MAQAKLHQYLSRDSYNRIEAWVAETNAALASHRAALPFIHSSPQPIRFPLSRTHIAHIAHVLDKNRSTDSVTQEMNLEDLVPHSVILKEEPIGREKSRACGLILKMKPETAAEKSQEQLLARESRPTPSKRGGFEQPAALSTSDRAPTSSTAKNEHYGYERRPRHRTKNDRYEYKDKKVRERNDRVSKRVKMTTNDTFHASNVPCNRLTLNRRGIQGIFKKGKASAPVKPRDSGQMPDLFGFDTPLTAWNLHSAHKIRFSESEFLLGKSDSDRICSNSKPTPELGEGCDSVKYPATSVPKHSNVVSDIPSPAGDCSSLRSFEKVNRASEPKGKDRVPAPDFLSGRALELHPKKLLSYYLSPPDTVVGPSKPNKAITDKTPQYYGRLEKARGFQERKYPSLSSGSETVTAKPPRNAKKADADEKDPRMLEKLVTSVRDDTSLELSGLPDANTCWQPVSAFKKNGSSSVAATEEFDHNIILDGGVHEEATTPHGQLSKPRVGSDGGGSFSMVEVGEPLERHESRATKATGELDYEIVDFTMISEAMDFSDIESVLDMEDRVTTVTHDTDMDDIDTASNMMMAPSETSCNTSTRRIQERSGPWLERRSPVLDRTGTEDLNMDIFEGLGRFWQRQRFY
ncbi:hypothetical protein BO78DRAFT_390549 [Aspergillus sclerotiicarbonarius CBS 121057]|uniref:Uncharacterized protein n=1 Tax=Aspergillus sclerotiicarbonarius (strain CBS 121057 / IBT 28362) TaxID=1448318 RepID=A0A319E690_ASPSB|nr:hypothetical protein BO78DRAFT_390549 [Aspergillus sclerotiicarbonarius CBS 121057]